MTPEPAPADARGPDVKETSADTQTFVYDAFSSYSREDTEFAAWLEADLELHILPWDTVRLQHLRGLTSCFHKAE